MASPSRGGKRCLMRFVIFLSIVTAAPVAGAQMLGGLSYAAPHPAVVRVVVPEADGTAYGSGTLIDVRDEYGLVLTNWHVVRNATGPIEVNFPSGFASQARSLKVDSEWDLAALVIWRPPCEPVRMASRPPRPGDPLTICGYGAGNYRAVTGRCTRFYAPRMELPQELVELDVEARQGDSGGPIFNERGELAGVLFGAGQGTTLGSFEGRVKTFLASLAPNIGGHDGAPQIARRQTCPTCQNCPQCRPEMVCENGVCRSRGDLGDVCFGCDKVAEHNRQRAKPSTNVSAPDDDWPKFDADRATVTWSTGKPDDERSSGESWPRFEGDTQEDASPNPPPSGRPLVSSSMFDTIKNALAIVGIVAIALQIVRLAG